MSQYIGHFWDHFWSLKIHQTITDGILISPVYGGKRYEIIVKNELTHFLWKKHQKCSVVGFRFPIFTICDHFCVTFGSQNGSCFQNICSPTHGVYWFWWCSEYTLFYTSEGKVSINGTLTHFNISVGTETAAFQNYKNF